MPGRLLPLVSGEYYHVFNRGLDRRITFSNKKEFQRAFDTIIYYRYAAPPVKLSRFLTLSEKDRLNSNKLLKRQPLLVSNLAYNLMPNHVHFIFRQLADKGIAIFMSHFQNSYTKYFNIRHERKGVLFEDQFKAVRVETDAQLYHLSRYIHLNPYTSYIVKTEEELLSYPWSSLLEYVGSSKGMCDKSIILSHFTKKSYRKFVLNQANYQRTFQKIKHLTIDI